MILATLGWGVWWTSVLLHKFMPGLSPGLDLTYVVTCGIAGVGFLLALFTIRARLIWVLLAGVPLFANGTLLLVPVMLEAEVAAMLGAPQGDSPEGSPDGASAEPQQPGPPG